ncbi:hypothetical protein F4818DRAFT_457398 [Hypoxylon cercidicola]|nr:hypothetical protein F4818DRAFT_457398 [Hypoxylon cercidicola]
MGFPRINRVHATQLSEEKDINYYLDSGIFPGDEAEVDIPYAPEIQEELQSEEELFQGEFQEFQGEEELFQGEYQEEYEDQDMESGGFQGEEEEEFQEDQDQYMEPGGFQGEDEDVDMVSDSEIYDLEDEIADVLDDLTLDTDDDSDEEQREEEERNHPTVPLVGDSDPDDPPSPTGSLGRTTVGVELEFLVAAALENGVPDAHPNDNRGLLVGAEAYGDENPMFQITIRNAIVDALRFYGLTAVKGESPHIYLGATSNFGWSSRLDDKVDNSNNLDSLGTWVGDYTWNPSMSQDGNVDAGTNRLLEQFIQFHVSHGLSFRRTTESVLWAIAKKIASIFIRNADVGAMPKFMSIWVDRAKGAVALQAAQEIARADIQVDPNAVLLEGADPRYRAWTCTREESFAAETATPAHYDLHNYVSPPGSKPPAPPSEYKWFSGEVISPILDFAHKDTYPAIERACTAIRDSFRVHKPMSVIGTGFHVHFGQEAGWTLLHLKKFTTLWLLLEEAIEKLHRRDRSDPAHMYSQSLRENSKLARNILVPSGGPAARSTVGNREPAKAAFYLARAHEHVPFQLAQINEYMQSLITEVWQYENIDDLNRGMTVHRGYGHIKYRLSGNTRTGSPHIGLFGPVLQTLEIRIMQGTLDSEHIWRWMCICHQMILFSRDATPRQFRDGLADMITSIRYPRDVLDIPANMLEWFQLRMNKATGYFEYLDRDRVSWSVPFMTRGGKNVYF